MTRNSTPILQNSLLLNRYFCSLFDFSTIEEAFGILKSNQPSNNIGEFLYFSELIAPHVINHQLLENLHAYDQNIQKYLFRINKSRNPKIRLKYFQYLAILFTEIYLHRYFTEKFIFCEELENFFKHEKIPFTPRFNKLAYWAATGSGKTIIMHINMLQWEKYSFFSKSYNNIILITPNQGLTLQHTLELTQSSIESSYIGGMQHNHLLPLVRGIVVKITEITKIKDHVKNLDGKSLPLEWFGEPNVVFIDEGHKGHVSETRVWKSLQSRLAGENGFTFEYSATFGEIVRDPEVFWEYATSIIFDYRYRFFYTDGFGKDFEIFNLSNQDEYDEIYLTTALLSFYQQKIYYQFHPKVKNQFHISEPLMIFVGSKVTGRKNRSDILLVIKFLNRFTSHVNHFSKIIATILQEEKERSNEYQQNVFHNHFLYLKKLIRDKTLELGNMHGYILDILFHSSSPSRCILTELSNSDGEIGLSLGDSFFGVINIGDTSSFLKLVQTHLNSEVIISPKSNFEDSLFFDLDNPQSDLNFLIGSKKFIEGWNSYRVSTMVLLNIGKREGPQIIQLFGRGVRLYGYGNSLLRSSAIRESTFFNLFGELPPIPKYMPLVETLNIFGLNADYMA
ncbi:MAG: DEAD/DEAH box helicase, partial [Promethearchaeota archaeon]